MSPLEITILSSILIVSCWVGWLNAKILMLTSQILTVTMHLDYQTAQIVANTSMPDDFGSSDVASQPT